jgi:hypothetical protein
MKILGMGLDFSGKPLFDPVDESVFLKALQDALAPNAATLQGLTRATAQSYSFRGEVEKTVVDVADPRTAGWSFLVNSADPQRKQIEESLKPLAVHRGMADPAAPLLFNGEPPDEWFDWINDNYFSMRLLGKEPPLYILIVGGPDQVPFHFQSLLDSVANVGRVDFDKPDDLDQYVKKLIRLETADDPAVTRDVIVFAPDGGPQDPTYFSREYMAKPLAEHVRDDLGFGIYTMFAADATKKKLQDALASRKPALVYTASHGLGAMGQPLAVQKRLNGAICCQHTGPLTLDALFMADDVPATQPFLEGAVFFQFACFGYGTPAESDYTHWFDKVPETYTDADFVAALPKRLLAHPRGPVAFIGHLDTAFLHGFADPEAPMILDRWHNRVAPFVAAVDDLLGVRPSALAMQDMNRRYSICNALLTNTYDQEKRGKLKWTPALEARFVDTWITRSDAQNYMVFGDPGARLRIPAAE